MDKMEAVGILYFLRATLAKDGCEDKVTDKVIEALTTACATLTESAFREAINEYVE